MRRLKWAAAEEFAQLEHIEICPEAMELTEEISRRLGVDGGGALIIDYGQNGIVSDSLQVRMILSTGSHFLQRNDMLF